MASCEDDIAWGVIPCNVCYATAVDDVADVIGADVDDVGAVVGVISAG